MSLHIVLLLLLLSAAHLDIPTPSTNLLKRGLDLIQPSEQVHIVVIYCFQVLSSRRNVEAVLPSKQVSRDISSGRQILVFSVGNELVIILLVKGVMLEGTFT